MTENKSLSDTFPFLTLYNVDYAEVNVNKRIPITNINYSEAINEKLSISAGFGFYYTNPRIKAVSVMEKRYYAQINNNSTNKNLVYTDYTPNDPLDEKPDRQVEDLVYQNKENRIKRLNIFPSIGLEYQINKLMNLNFGYTFSIYNPYHKDVNGFSSLNYTSLGLNFNVYTFKKKSNKSLDTSQQ
jgi:hypothetical protein